MFRLRPDLRRVARRVEYIFLALNAFALFRFFFHPATEIPDHITGDFYSKVPTPYNAGWNAHAAQLIRNQDRGPQVLPGLDGNFSSWAAGATYPGSTTGKGKGPIVQLQGQSRKWGNTNMLRPVSAGDAPSTSAAADRPWQKQLLTGLIEGLLDVKDIIAGRGRGGRGLGCVELPEMEVCHVLEGLRVRTPMIADGVDAAVTQLLDRVRSLDGKALTDAVSQCQQDVSDLLCIEAARDAQYCHGSQPPQIGGGFVVRSNASQFTFPFSMERFGERDPSAGQDTATIAYVVMLHALPGMAKQLLRAVYDRRHFFVFHVGGSPENQLRLNRLVAATVPATATNVFVMATRHTAWAGFSLVRILLDALDVLQKHNVPFDYAINLSGQDFPLQTNREIAEWLATRGQGMSYAHSGGPLPIDQHYRINRFWYECENDSIYALPFKAADGSPLRKDKDIKEDSILKGSQWVILARNFSEYIISDAPEVRRWTNFFKRSLVSDESFFQTILANTPHHYPWVPRDMRYWRWPAPGQGDSRHPLVLTSAYLDDMLASSAFFARKFEPVLSREAIVQLAERIDRKKRKQNKADSATPKSAL